MCFFNPRTIFFQTFLFFFFFCLGLLKRHPERKSNKLACSSHPHLNDIKEKFPKKNQPQILSFLDMINSCGMVLHLIIGGVRKMIINDFPAEIF